MNTSLRVAVATARLLRTRVTCFVGIGVPSLAAMLAKRLHAPELNLIYESGVIGAHPATPPLSTGSPSVAAGAEMVGRMIDVFGALQDGRIEVGLLSAAQVDRTGNLNSTLVSSAKGQRRLPGSGGALDIALLANELIILMPHEKRRLVEKVDFVTSPGRAATRAHSQRIVTDLGSFAFSESVISLETCYEDVDPAVAAQFGNAVVDHSNAKPIPVPTEEEIRIFKTFADEE